MRRRILTLLGSSALLVPMLVQIAPAAHATFPGANGRITFAQEVPDGLQIFSASAQGDDVQQLTSSDPGTSSVFSDWSPDGSTIAFDSDRTGNVQVYTMNWDGSNSQRLTTGDGFAGDPAYSPGGQQLAIESDWNDYPASEGIWIIPASKAGGVTQADAHRVTTIPVNAGGDSEPQFSPDAQWIVFTRFITCQDQPKGNGRQPFDAHGCKQAIYRVHTDGSDLQQLTPFGQTNSSPDFSPDGRQIVFDSCDSGRTGCTGDIYVMNADGSHRHRIVKGAAVSGLGLGDNRRFPLTNNPVWSPDGSQILFTQWVGNGRATELDTVNPDGSGLSTLVSLGDFVNKADWGKHS